MIATLVEFFLDGEGQQTFSQWVSALGAAVSTHDGFLDVRQLTPFDDPNRTLFLLHFDTMVHTQQWGASADRAGLLTHIQPYWLRESVITHFTVGPAWAPTP